MKEWEMYNDTSYYHMWDVRYIYDRDYNSPRLFHFYKEKDAKHFLELVLKSNYATA